MLDSPVHGGRLDQGVPGVCPTPLMPCEERSIGSFEQYGEGLQLVLGQYRQIVDLFGGHAEVKPGEASEERRQSDRRLESGQGRPRTDVWSVTEGHVADRGLPGDVEGIGVRPVVPVRGKFAGPGRLAAGTGVSVPFSASVYARCIRSGAGHASLYADAARPAQTLANSAVAAARSARDAAGSASTHVDKAADTAADAGTQAHEAPDPANLHPAQPRELADGPTAVPASPFDVAEPSRAEPSRGGRLAGPGRLNAQVSSRRGNRVVSFAHRVDRAMMPEVRSRAGWATAVFTRAAVAGPYRPGVRTVGDFRDLWVGEAVCGAGRYSGFFLVGQDRSGVARESLPRS
ncbi:hypothetical protein DSC45_20990 [Streptomyces sp. YIM 130001]|nr:hypothetical protein DSC45_20990 [Streptomyces sp. YIM 130001]